MSKPLTKKEWREIPFAWGISCPVCDYQARLEATIENGGFAEEKTTWEHVLAYHRVEHRGLLPDVHDLLLTAVRVGLKPSISAAERGWFLNVATYGQTMYALEYLFEVRDVLALEIYSHDMQKDVDHLIDEIAKPA